MNSNFPKIGKYVLDSLSIGMYNSPLMLLREYIQNSTDAIDEEKEYDFKGNKEFKIDIQIDGRNRSLKIFDTGAGVPIDQAFNLLLSIGESNKNSIKNRGFRGIGRLGGLGYCDNLKFKTKARGEDVYTICNWDCNKLRKLIKDKNNFNAPEIIKKVTDFGQYPYKGSKQEHFFDVKMENVISSRDILLNVPKVKSYLSEVIPAPFNFDKFSLAEEIDTTLRKNVSKYQTYSVYLNGKLISKPYVDRVMIRGKIKDRISDIKYVELSNIFGKSAFGWIGKLRLLGSIAPSSLVDGIRIRSGNILVGDKNLLSEFFRERRFNSYLIGELHIINHKLIPNSRRDDFEDNEYREEFYDCFIKEIGLPYSREIRKESYKRSIENNKLAGNKIIERVDYIVKKGYFSEIQKNKIKRELENLKHKNNGNNDNYLNKKIIDLNKAQSFFNKEQKTIPINTGAFLKKISDVIFENSSDQSKADKIVRNIINISKNSALSQ